MRNPVALNEPPTLCPLPPGVGEGLSAKALAKVDEGSTPRFTIPTPEFDLVVASHRFYAPLILPGLCLAVLFAGADRLAAQDEPVTTAAHRPVQITKPISVLVGPGPAWPVVSLRTPRNPEKTGEPCPTCFVAPGELEILRTGPTTEPLRVYLDADGTAMPEVDYQRLPATVTIPAGTNTTRVPVVAFDDRWVEGPEVVRARIDHPPKMANLGYLVDVEASQAYVVIGDDEPGAPEARLDILEPFQGALLASSVPIPLQALGVFTRGEIDRSVEFFANGELVGRSSPVATGRPSIPCLPNVHVFTWTNPPAGRHILTARSEIGLNQFVEAPPVPIVVFDSTLQISLDTDGTVRFVIPQGSLAPGYYDLESCSDLRTWTRLGPFEPGNVAAFYFDRPPLPAQRFYRAAFHPMAIP